MAIVYAFPCSMYPSYVCVFSMLYQVCQSELFHLHWSLFCIPTSWRTGTPIRNH